MLQASIVASEALQGSVTPIALADEPPFFYAYYFRTDSSASLGMTPGRGQISVTVKYPQAQLSQRRYGRLCSVSPEI